MVLIEIVGKVVVRRRLSSLRGAARGVVGAASGGGNAGAWPW